MAKFDILEDLKWRGAINQETDEEGLKKYLAEHDDLALYCGKIGRASCRERV